MMYILFDNADTALLEDCVITNSANVEFTLVANIVIEYCTFSNLQAVTSM